jgi:hypothetical protein
MKLKFSLRRNFAGALFVAVAIGWLPCCSGANQPPVILEARATPNPMLWNEPVTYTVAAQDADGDALTYRWLFADGLIATNAVATNRVPSGFTSNLVSVVVSDGHGGSATNTFSITAQNDPSMWSGKVGAPFAPDNWTRGHKRALIMTLAFPDFTPVITSNGIASAMLSLSNYFNECSHGQFQFEAVITPVLLMSQTTTNYVAPNVAALFVEAHEAARALGFPAEDYDFDIYLAPGNKGLPGTTGSLANRLLFINQLGGVLNAGVVGHEVGHCLGLDHANRWNTSDRAPLGPGVDLPYGNPFCIMGDATSFPRGHFITPYKHRLHWLDDTNTSRVTTSGVYRLAAHDVPTLAASNRYALRINKDVRDYWIEYRQQFTTNLWAMNGVSVLWSQWPNSAGQAEILDCTPGTPLGGVSPINGLTDTTDITLAVGRTLSDHAAGIHITPVARAGTSPEAMDVVVNLGFFTNNSPPTISLAASATNVAVNTPVNFTATANDPNGDALAFYWSCGDWKWSSTNGPALTKSWTTPGDYVVRCEVSDMKGGVASAQVVVRVGSPATLRVSGSVTQGGLPLEGVRVNVASNLMAWTDSAGNYTVTGVPAGSYQLSATGNGLTFTRSFSNPVNVSADTTGRNFTGSLVNTPPTNTPISDVSISEDDIAAVTFTVGDAQSPGREIMLLLASDNPALLPERNMRVTTTPGGTGGRTIKMKPEPNQSGVAHISINLSDGFASTNVSFTVTVNPVDDAPLSRGLTVNANGPLVQSAATGALSATTEADGDAVTAMLVAPPLNGQVFLQTNGGFNYVPNPGFLGVDSFGYAGLGFTTGNVAIVSLVVSSNSSTPYDLWALGQFGANFANPALASADADPDSDGSANFFEYASGLNPLLAETSGKPVGTMMNIGGTNFLAIQFNRLLAATDARFTVQAGSNLVTWTDGSTYAATSSVPVTPVSVEVSRSGAPVERITVRSTTPAAVAPQGFLGLRVNRE